ncbi:hypothetical protein [Runella slithyformis]|uniref:Lipocalin-like domain-containing protein n=1 Tax=Runella slithyformis (strain ATCC 29530 / DSM 19594 / LMG 11500 / NCIMB 11436 / LSU 4) TaxID=761193 RepID=A0A7U4E4G7_RUNSL|nr:hypothetical protein [Runella slithyformis]AEI47128.1 hypothetical protein Runsl_0685 [Runella slithyformis DSM 19594]
MNARLLFSIIVLLLMFSCQNEQNKFVQAEFDKAQGSWTIEKVTLPATAPESLKVYVRSAAFLLSQCKYNAKDFAQNSGTCGGDFEVNGQILRLNYNYLYDKKLFQWSLAIIEQTRTPATINAYLSASQIFDGNWEIVITDNKMTAKRVGVDKPYQPQETVYKGEIIFTATRK